MSRRPCHASGLPMGQPTPGSSFAGLDAGDAILLSPGTSNWYSALELFNQSSSAARRLLQALLCCDV